MAGIAFYAPLKPPDHPVPSGDRTFGRALQTALARTGLGDVFLASRLRSRDGKGDASLQDGIFAEAEAEIARLAAIEPPALWVTYHNYYKAPDLLGPVLARRWGIPYAIVEATRASKRLDGPHARFAAAAERACDAADLILYLTERDREALERDRPAHQALVRLRPFLPVDVVETATPRRPSVTFRLLVCAMFRAGDKMASYAALAAALRLSRSPDWRLTVVGDGPERAAVRTLFGGMGHRVDFVGAVEQERVAEHFRAADMLVWPGVGEAFGMVYLEAQAQGCPALAEDRPGVRDVVRDGGWLVPQSDPAAFAAAIDRLAGDRQAVVAAAERGRAQIARDHLLGSAVKTLSAALAPLMTGPVR